MTDLLPTHKGHAGLRFNAGKDRLDLLPPSLMRAVAKVLTKGAIKYAERNWENGLGWMGVVASCMRHLQSWLEGEDVDPETGEPHLSLAATNLAFLIHFRDTYPQGDDRPCFMPKLIRLGLDIDEVLADWVGAWCERHGITERPTAWGFHRDLPKMLDEVKGDKDFWMSIKPLVKPEEIPYEPTVYVTKRVIPNEWTMDWLDMHRFPVADVVTIAPNENKLPVLQQYDVQLFVDDNIHTFNELNKGGINCLLLDAAHNRRYNVGSRRIYSLKEIK